ncbi:MAG: alcohol dehydrogenase catalytic domain-containing protein [Phycisphaerales bacterium]
MRAVRYDGQNVFIDPRAAEPAPREGEALVRPVRVGIGPADLAVCRGLLPFKGVIGREFVGVVVRVEGDKDHPLTASRVICDPLVIPEHDDLARRGLGAHAPDRQELGVHGRDGALAQRLTIPVRNLHAVPDAIDDDHAALAVPLAEAIHLTRLVAVETKPYVTVVGDDAVALLCAQLLAVRNASVRVLGSLPGRESRCEKWGIGWRQATDVGRRADQDVVLIVDPSDEALDLALGLVRPCGRVVVGGGPLGSTGFRAAPTPGASIARLVEREARLIGARGGRVADALGALASMPGRLDLAGLITRRYRFDDAVAALRAAAEPEQVRVVVDL